MNEMNEDMLYTDLACERRRADLDCHGIEYRKERNINGVWERIRIKSEAGARAMGKPMGYYDSLHTVRLDRVNYEEIMGLTEELAGEICEMLEKVGAVGTNVLVVGLGNQGLTPDATGPDSADKISPTRHIAECDEGLFSTLGCARLSVIKPGVESKSGISSALAVLGISREIKPDLVIAIDSLMARGRERLGSTIQISSTGICPGSGIGRSGGEISERTLGVPVIAIGVPTVIDSHSLCDEGTDKKRGEGLMMSPKEIGEIVKNAAEIIGGAINLSFGIFS